MLTISIKFSTHFNSSLFSKLVYLILNLNLLHLFGLHQVLLLHFIDSLNQENFVTPCFVEQVIQAIDLRFQFLVGGSLLVWDQVLFQLFILQSLVE
mgnify:CR=1 FL=1